MQFLRACHCQMDLSGNGFNASQLTSVIAWRIVANMKATPTPKQNIDPITDPVKIIEQFYLERKNNNSSYSLTAFALALGLSPSQLSRILSGKRNLSPHQASRIAAALNLSNGASTSFVRNAILKAPKGSKVSKATRAMASREITKVKNTAQSTDFPLTQYSVERFRVISQWYHSAILNLTFVKGFNPAPEWIAKRLGISVIEAKNAISRLLNLGLLETCQKKGLKKGKGSLYIKTERSEPEMRRFHTEMIDKAKTALEKTSDEDFLNRFINSITFPCDFKSIPEIRTLIIDFEKSILELIQNVPHEEVYQLNCQLFPLTKPIRGKK